MSNYLELVNKVLAESGKEQDPLDEDSWDSLDASRRIYPRVKRLVRESWKAIQMSRNEWEFNSAELTTTVYPRIKFIDGYAPDGVAVTWRGTVSNTVIILQDTELLSGDFEDGDAQGQFQFEVISGTYIEMSEEFVSEEPMLPGSFIYVEKGTYSFMAETFGLIREPHWTTFVAGRDTAYPNPVAYIPWDNFTFKSYTFVGTSQSVPNYVTQDYQGRLVFYPQPIVPFTISFIHDVAPQELIDWDDVPLHLPPEYHDWIAWDALKSLARFDKDPDLFAYADDMAESYLRRAERSLLPIPSYRASPFNRQMNR